MELYLLNLIDLVPAELGNSNIWPLGYCLDRDFICPGQKGERTGLGIPDETVDWKGCNGPTRAEAIIRRGRSRAGFGNLSRLLEQGGETIRGKDLASVPTITFQPAARILRPPEIIRQSRKDTIFRATHHRGSVHLAFKFLDKGDGALLRILHDGSPASRLNITTTIMGCPKGTKLLGLLSFGPPREKTRFIFLITYFLVAVTGTLIIAIRMYLRDELTTWMPFLFLSVVLGCLFAAVTEIRGFLAYRRFPQWSRGTDSKGGI